MFSIFQAYVENIQNDVCLEDLYIYLSEVKEEVKKGSKLASLVEVMCYAQDDSFFASPWYRPARSTLLPALKAHLPRLQSRLGAKASKNFLFNSIL